MTTKELIRLVRIAPTIQARANITCRALDKGANYVDLAKSQLSEVMPEGWAVAFESCRYPVEGMKTIPIFSDPNGKTGAEFLPLLLDFAENSVS